MTNSKRTTRRIDARSARQIPWKNGLGVTNEIAVWPEASSFERGDFDWRISSATVDSNGPYSSFEDFERILVVTDGDGLALDHGSAAPARRVLPLEPYRFAGAWPTTSELLGRPVHNFNVMFRPDRFTAGVEVLRLDEHEALRRASLAGHTLLHVLDGSVNLAPDDPSASLQLHKGDSLWISQCSATDPLDVEGVETSLLILAQITPNSGNPL